MDKGKASALKAEAFDLVIEISKKQNEINQLNQSLIEKQKEIEKETKGE